MMLVFSTTTLGTTNGVPSLLPRGGVSDGGRSSLAGQPPAAAAGLAKWSTLTGQAKDMSWGQTKDTVLRANWRHVTEAKSRAMLRTCSWTCDLGQIEGKLRTWTEGKPRTWCCGQTKDVVLRTTRSWRQYHTVIIPFKLIEGTHF